MASLKAISQQALNLPLLYPTILQLTHFQFGPGMRSSALPHVTKAFSCPAIIRWLPSPWLTPLASSSETLTPPHPAGMKPFSDRLTHQTESHLSFRSFVTHLFLSLTNPPPDVGTWWWPDYLSASRSCLTSLFSLSITPHSGTVV
jgi:hypothetical protein